MLESVFRCAVSGGGEFPHNFVHTSVVVRVVRQEQDGVGGAGGRVRPQVGVGCSLSREGGDASAACIEATHVGART